MSRVPSTTEHTGLLQWGKFIKLVPHPVMLGPSTANEVDVSELPGLWRGCESMPSCMHRITPQLQTFRTYCDSGFVNGLAIVIGKAHLGRRGWRWEWELQLGFEHGARGGLTKQEGYFLGGQQLVAVVVYTDLRGLIGVKYQ